MSKKKSKAGLYDRASLSGPIGWVKQLIPSGINGRGKSSFMLTRLHRYDFLVRSMIPSLQHMIDTETEEGERDAIILIESLDPSLIDDGVATLTIMGANVSTYMKAAGHSDEEISEMVDRIKGMTTNQRYALLDSVERWHLSDSIDEKDLFTAGW